MIILNTKWLLKYFKLDNLFVLKNGTFVYNSPSKNSKDKNIDLICKILTARLFGDSINYTLSVQKNLKSCITKKISSNIDLLSLFFLIENDLINYTPDNQIKMKDILTAKEKLLSFYSNDEIKENYIPLAILILNYIFYEDFESARSSLNKIPENKKFIYLKKSLLSFLFYQEGKYDKIYKQLDVLSSKEIEKSDIFQSVCLNFLAYIQILDGKYEHFQKTCDLLEDALKVENSNLQPMIISNILYLKQAIISNSAVSWIENANKHHDNILRYKQSKELDLLNNLENSSLKAYNNEIYDNIKTYGIETHRFTNAPNTINSKLARYIFLYSYFGSYSAVKEGQTLLHKIFLSLGINNADQDMIRHAAHYAIIKGTSKEIEKTFRSSKFTKNKEAIEHCKKLIAQNKLGGTSSIGLSSMICYVYRFLDDISLTYASKHLVKELQKPISFNSQFDHVLPALKASAYLSCMMSKDKMSSLLSALLHLINDNFSDRVLLDEFNKMAYYVFSDDCFLSNPTIIKKIIKLYLDNLSKILDEHDNFLFHSLLALKRFVALENSSISRNNYLNILSEQLKNSKNSSVKNIFLYKIQSSLNNSIGREESQNIISIIRKEVLNPDVDTYTKHIVSSFDPVSLFSDMIQFFDEDKDKKNSIEILKNSLFEPKCSISNKIQITVALEKNKQFIDFNSANEIQKYLFDIKENLFLERNREHFLLFRSTSVPVFRALLYRLVSMSKVNWVDSYLLDLLRISVSTDKIIRQIFIESADSFCKSNPDNSEAMNTLLNRCYELSFDSDPKVKGQSCFAMLSISKNSGKAISKDVLHRIVNLSKDSSEIVRCNVAIAIKKNKDILSKEIFEEIRNRLLKDIDFYVRKNISELERN